MSGTWAVVPAKTFDRAKSRLAPVLDDAARRDFARALFVHLLDVLAAAPLDGILVATDGDDVAALARARGCKVCRDAGDADLASIVDRALASVVARGAEVALAIMADLPLVAAADVEALLALAADHEVVVAPDRDGTHTNALVLRPPAAIATAFGSGDSFALHRARAASRGLRVAVHAAQSIAFDVDEPADLVQDGAPKRKASSRTSRA